MSRTTPIDMKLEVVVIPVADVDRSKHFYTSLGWRLDIDFVKGDEFRAVQFTPPGSPSSIHFGKGLTTAVPGSVRGLFLIVTDIVAARAELAERGVDVSDVFHSPGLGEKPRSGREPGGHSYASFVSFSDPDGNSWLVQEVTARLPGRVDTNNGTAFSSAAAVESALRRAAAAHGEHEKLIGKPDAEWPVWYAEYIVAEQTGKPLPT